MLQIVLIRPGSTDYDRQERIQGTLDIPLDKQGAAELPQLADELKDASIETVYAPECEPAEQTARSLAKSLGAKFRKLDRMQNLDHGLWQGMLIKDVRKKQPKVYRLWQEQPETVCPPEGETLSEADTRVRSAVTKLVKRHKQGVIGLVVPEPLATLVRRFVRHDELGNLWKVSTEHGRWEVLTVEPEEMLQHIH